MRKLLAAFILIGLVVPSLAPAAGAGHTEEHPVTAEITLRVAPDGFVVPGHWTAGNEAVWLIDPAEDQRFNDQAGIAGCTLVVPDTNDDGFVDGVEALENATATGCITGWNGTSSDGAVFVTSVDGRDEVADPVADVSVVWWVVQYNGHFSPVGVSDLALEDGDTLSFVYHAGL